MIILYLTSTYGRSLPSSLSESQIKLKIHRTYNIKITSDGLGIVNIKTEKIDRKYAFLVASFIFQ
jgi:hypothetical protein